MIYPDYNNIRSGILPREVPFKSRERQLKLSVVSKMADGNHSSLESEPEQTVLLEAEKDVLPPSPKCTEVRWQEEIINLIAAQQKQLEKLMRQSNMATSASSSSWPTPSDTVAQSHNTQAHVAGPMYQSFKLTDYDPDNSAYSIEEWLHDATKLKEELSASDNLMISKASEALQNRGYRHCCDWRPRCRTWESFCADIIVAFPDKETPGTRAYKAATLRSSDCDSLCEYGNQKLRSINRFHDKLPWNTILSMVEYGLDHEETRAALHIQKPKSERELLQLLSESDARTAEPAKMSKHTNLPVMTTRNFKRRFHSDRGEGHVRKTKIIRGACFKCGRQGHRQSDCRNVQKEEVPKQAREKQESTSVPTCGHCKKIGHTEPNCWYKHGKPKKAFLIKK